jgi:hypothetical protein
MFSTRSVFAPALLLAVVFVSACDDRSPSAPSPISPAPSPVSSPAPSPTPDLSHLVGVWNLTLRLTEVTGGGCVTEAMQSQIGLANRYSLSVEQASGSTLDVTLASASGGYSCTFTNVPADSSGFTTVGRRGLFLSCLGGVVLRDFRCGDGTLDLISWSQDISARVSGTEISGQWVAGFADGPVYLETTWAETKAEFIGSR